MDAILQDLRFALRTLRRAPSITLLVVGSLALAIAGNTTVFSLINAVLYRPMPFEDPHRIALVGEYQDPVLAGSVTTTSGAQFVDLRERQQSFSSMAAYRSSPANLEGTERGEPVNVAAVTPGFFALLGKAPELGRAFLQEEGRPGAAGVAVLTHTFWESRYGGDPEVLGKTLKLNGKPHTVVGVLPEKFEFLDPTVKIWTALALDPAQADRSRRGTLVLGRMASGVTTAEAHAEMEALGRQLAEEYPETNQGYTTQAVNLREGVPDSRNRQLFALLQGALVFVLLIACANIANLLLARAQSRVTELAVRTSLGAGRRRIIRQLLTESLLMSLVGGLLGAALGALGTSAVTAALGSQFPRFWTPVIDTRVLLFTLGITVLAGILVGLAPAIQASRLSILGALKDGGRGATAGGKRRLAANSLVVAEIALALVLLGGASVLIRSFLDLQNTDPGFEASGLVTLRINLPEDSYPDETDLSIAADELQDRLAGLPGVESLGASSIRPRSPGAASEPFVVDSAPPAEGQAAPSALSVVASAGFFESVGIPLLEGRGFEVSDRRDTAPVVLINRSLAQRFWPEGDPLGQRLTIRGESRRIVGVVEDVMHAFILNQTFQPTFYLPLAQEPQRSVALTLRTGGDPESLANPVREAILGYDSNLVVGEVQSLEDYMSQFFAGMQVFTAILGAFGSLALLLAALGTYGVLAYAVARRTHEIGVRMAIGARRRQVMGMVARQGLVLAGIGIALGVPGVLLVTRAISSSMSDFATVEPGTVVGVAVMLAAVTLVASWLPARRASRVDPAVALRD